MPTRSLLRLLMVRLLLSVPVVVDQVHVRGFAALESEHDTPVAGDSHTPLARTRTLQWMQSEARCIGAPRVAGFLQPEQNPPQPRREGSGQSRRIVVLMQCPKSLCLIRIRPSYAVRYAP